MSAGDIRYAARCRHGCSDFATEEAARDSARRWLELGGVTQVAIERWTSDGSVYQPEHIETMRQEGT